MKSKLVEFEHRARSRRSSAASRSWSASTGSPRPSPRRSPPATARSSPCRTTSRPSRSRGSRPGAPRATRKAVAAALKELRAAAAGRPQHHAGLDRGAKAGVTTGEWGAALREAFGEYRAPTGVGRAARNDSPAGSTRCAPSVERVSRKLGRRIKFLVGKPGLDGHSNGAEQIAVRARDAGMEVVYEGIRLTPAEIVNAALEEGVHVVGLSILSGSHVPLVKDVVARMRAAGLDDVPVIVGGIIPPDDASTLKRRGRRRRLHAEGLRAEPHHGGHRADRGRRRRQGGVNARLSHFLSLPSGRLRPSSRAMRGEGAVRGFFPRATRRRGSLYASGLRPSAPPVKPGQALLPAARGEGKTPAPPGSPASRGKRSSRRRARLRRRPARCAPIRR